MVRRTAAAAIWKIIRTIPLTTGPATTRVDDIPRHSRKRGSQLGQAPWSQGCDVLAAAACDFDTRILDPPSGFPSSIGHGV